MPKSMAPALHQLRSNAGVRIEDSVRDAFLSVRKSEKAIVGIYDVRRYSRAASSEDSDLSTNECENAVVACPCGTDSDDGQSMVECERCKEWAPTERLRTMKVTHTAGIARRSRAWYRVRRHESIISVRNAAVAHQMTMNIRRGTRTYLKRKTLLRMCVPRRKIPFRFIHSIPLKA